MRLEEGETYLLNSSRTNGTWPSRLVNELWYFWIKKQMISHLTSNATPPLEQNNIPVSFVRSSKTMNNFLLANKQYLKCDGVGLNVNRQTIQNRPRQRSHCSFSLQHSQTPHPLLSVQCKTTSDPSKAWRSTGMLSTPEAVHKQRTQIPSNLHGNEEGWRLWEYRVSQQVKDVCITEGNGSLLDSKAALQNVAILIHNRTFLNCSCITRKHIKCITVGEINANPKCIYTMQMLTLTDIHDPQSDITQQSRSFSMTTNSEQPVKRYALNSAAIAFQPVHWLVSATLMTPERCKQLCNEAVELLL